MGCCRLAAVPASEEGLILKGVVCVKCVVLFSGIVIFTKTALKNFLLAARIPIKKTLVTMLFLAISRL